MSACSLTENWNELSPLETEISTNNEKGYTLTDEGKYEEAIGYFEQAIEDIYQLHPSLKDLKEEVELTELIDSPFNNLSWALNELRKYEESLEAIDKSLLILPNTDTEYVNKGNALYGLNRSEEAIAQYDKAIELNDISESAYYGKGTIYYDQGKYKESLEQINKYLTFQPDDPDALETAIYSHLNLDEDDKALALAEGYLTRNPEEFDAYRLKGDVLESTMEFEDVKAFYEQMKDKFPDLPEAQMKLGDLYFDNEKYNLSLDYFQELSEEYPDNMDIYIKLINIHSELEDIDKAESVYKIAIKVDNAYPDLYTAMGDAYMDNSLYVEAVPLYEKVIALDSQDEFAYISKLRALYWGKRNLRCVKFGEEAAKLNAVSSNIAWFTGECNLDLGNFNAAITNFKEAVRIDPEDSEAYSNMANAYMLLEDYKQAAEFSAKSLELDPEDSQALYIQEELKDKEKPLGERVRRFFNENYLYKDSLPNLEQSLKGLDRPSISSAEIAKVIDGARRKDDIFTYTIYGDDYDLMTAEGAADVESYKEEDGMVYFRIHDFNATTDDKFVEVLDRIQDTESKILVIDMRDNGGGYTNSSNNMLNVLLPEYVTSSLIYNDGNTDSYYSDASHIDFKHIYIFVDEYTASAAELLTLGLKSYLNNVTVIGRNTFGKGVGQLVFEDKKNKIMVFVVNHYWNVKQNNVMNSHIKPDITVQGNNLEAFMVPVKKALQAKK
ncbi:tetratricopeptide repeat protein [Paenibacillus sp. sgz500958]|uniref:tetratricopeptide repeat protein n=1 Tax=Paenibacillus sp. sgz500958 TaxID=3242475 RepID=UPI0036D3E254